MAKMNILQWEKTYLDRLSGVERKKYLQKIQITKYLYVHGSKTNSDICKRLTLSSPTTIGLLNELIKEDLVEKQGRADSNGGRRPDLFGLKKNSLFVLGIDMGRYTTRIAIFNNNNQNITGIQSFRIKLGNDIKAVDELYRNASQLIKSSGIDSKKIMGIGINMPGLVDSVKGINYTYLNFGDKSIQTILEEKFNRPVFVENDAKARTLAEYRFGLAKGKKNVLVLFLDWGIGLGMLLNGKLYRGASGFSGEFSHIPMLEDGLLCRCGKHGCLETLASGTTLAQLAKEGIKSGKNSILNKLADEDIDKIQAQYIVDAANSGDQYAISILSEIGINLGKGIAILIQILNPELIILGGRIAEAKQYITTPIQQSLNWHCMSQLSEKTSIAISELEQNAGILGAVATVMENIFENYNK